MQIELENVTVRYRRDRPPALDSVSVSVAPGEQIAVIGSSGAGKSTLFKLLTRSLVARHGRVTMNGIDTAAGSFREIRRLRQHIGTIHQRGDLIDVSSVMKNVAMGTLAEAGPRAALSLAALGARRHAAHACTQALDALEIGHLTESRVTDLSGGQRQRVAVCRLLVQRPLLILADEPTASVDARSATLVLESLERLAAANGSTLLLATHDVEVARRADRVVALAHGRIVYDGTAEDLTDDVVSETYASARQAVAVGDAMP